MGGGQGAGTGAYPDRMIEGPTGSGRGNRRPRQPGQPGVGKWREGKGRLLDGIWVMREIHVFNSYFEHYGISVRSY